jgi:hypothetical protein
MPPRNRVKAIPVSVERLEKPPSALRPMYSFTVLLCGIFFARPENTSPRVFPVKPPEVFVKTVQMKKKTLIGATICRRYPP